jgi:hypothetical protein
MINAVSLNTFPNDKAKTRVLLNSNTVVQNPFTILPVKQYPVLNQKAFLPYISQPISFGYYFAFKELQNLPCPCCGRIMSTNKEIENFVKNVANATGQDLIAVLERYKDRLPATERNVVNRLVNTAEKFGDFRLDRLLNQILREPKKDLELKQKEILKEIENLSKGLTGETYKVIRKDISSIDSIIKDGKNGDPFKRKKLIQGLEKVRDNEANPDNRKILESIVKKAEDMPTSGSDANAFIVKYSRRKPSEIAHRLIEPSQSTAEHIHPHSKEGKDNASNYLAECKKCNNDRGNMSYVDWLKIYPEMISNSQIYMNEIMKRIITGEIKGFDFYPRAVKKAVCEESERLIDLDVSKMDEYRKKKYKTLQQAGLNQSQNNKLNTVA